MSEKEDERKEKQTTIRVTDLLVVKMHMLEQGEKTLNKYINELIKQDILRNGSEYIIKKYFKGN